MIRFSILGFAAAFMWLASTEPASAQAPPQPVPIELFGCNYVDGAGMDELQAAIDSYNEWADDNDVNSAYTAMLVPHFYSAELPFDVLFMTRWANGVAMGAGLAKIMADGGADFIADFEAAIDCPVHSYFAGVLVTPPAEPRDGGPIQFFNCTVKENRTAGDGIEGIRGWAEATQESGTGVGSGHAVWFPIAGESPAATYTFKWIVLLPDYQAFGDSFDRLVGGGGAQVAANTTSPVMDCDSARLYNQITLRQMQQ